MSGTDIAMIVIGISVAAIAIFLVQTLRKVQLSLDAAGKTLQEVQQTIHVWKDDVGELMGSARKLTDRVDDQILAIEPIMATVRETGEALHEVAGVAHQFSSLWSAKLSRRAQAAAAKDAAKAAARREAEARRQETYRQADTATERGVANMEAAVAAEGTSGMNGLDVDRSGYVHYALPAAEQPPAWLAWMETGVQVAKLIAKRQ